MKISIGKIPGKYDGKECYVHARACAINDKELIMTMQKLDVRGTDKFSPILVSLSDDGGKTWSEPAFDPHLDAGTDEDGRYYVPCDAVHLWHKHTNSALLIGTEAFYDSIESLKPLLLAKQKPFYTVYDKDKREYKSVKFLELPDELKNAGVRSACIQLFEKENGDILMPVYVMQDNLTVKYGGETSPRYTVAVLRCGFDGNEMWVKEVGNMLTYEVERGIVEPSLICFDKKYYLTLRNDTCGLVSISDDGIHFSSPEVWQWDTEEPLPNYNTQQHWLICGGKLYLVYTRRSGNNDHVFRNRAPLYMAEIDTEKVRVLRHTEVIVAPERGARLGNFGVTQIDENHAIITAAEWMQNIGCEKFGSDNSIWVTHVSHE